MNFSIYFFYSVSMADRLMAHSMESGNDHQLQFSTCKVLNLLKKKIEGRRDVHMIVEKEKRQIVDKYEPPKLLLIMQNTINLKFTILQWFPVMGCCVTSVEPTQ